VRVLFGDGRVGLKTAQAEVFARLIDGEFPRYSAVIPEAGANVIEADADLMARKLRLVSNVTSQDTRAVRLSFSKGLMQIFGKSTGYGEASAEMETTVKGDPDDVAYNPDYLMDGIKNCETDVVRLEFNERTSPGKFTLGENYLYVVMPITIDT
jgi:DNA polymerase-3 subunit beta